MKPKVDLPLCFPSAHTINLKCPTAREIMGVTKRPRERNKQYFCLLLCGRGSCAGSNAQKTARHGRHPVFCSVLLQVAPLILQVHSCAAILKFILGQSNFPPSLAQRLYGSIEVLHFFLGPGRARPGPLFLPRRPANWRRQRGPFLRLPRM